MNSTSPQDSSPRPGSNPQRHWSWLMATSCVLLVLLALLPLREQVPPDANLAGATSTQADPGEDPPVPPPRRERLGRSAPETEPELTAEQIVANKVLQFGRSRREIVRRIARRTQKEIPPEIEKFFDALEGGNWKEIEAQATALGQRSGQYEGSTHSPELDPFWPTVLDAYGAAEQAHEWPAQKLLDYGNAILDSLQPGMVYVGGTDPGRWIPELLNETSGREPHIIITQNALADSRYLEYITTLYSDRFGTLTEGDSKRVFEDYVADARRRWEHDQQFPDDARQVRGGEKLTMNDGKFEVTGQAAVMAINEKLLQLLMQRNPDLSFAIEQSFAFKSTYENATPVGPIMELGGRDEPNALTRQRAAQSVDYWRATANELLNDPQAADSYSVRMSYAKLALEQAELFRHRQFPAEAEQTFRFAAEMAPASTELVNRYVDLLVEQNRYADAIAVAERALQFSPEAARWAEADQTRQRQATQQFRDLLSQLRSRTRR